MTTREADWSWRAVAPWLAAAAALLQFVNAARAFADPAGFAAYLGLPFTDPGAAALVRVYALRALFIGSIVVALLATRQRRALFWVALLATIMPVGDALLSAQAQAPGATVARHIGIAIYLLVTSWLFHRAGRLQP